MDFLNYVFQMLVRLRYPVSMPQDIACALRIQMPNTVRFHELLAQLTNPDLTLPTLIKYMPREEAERAFKEALRKERFQKSSLYSFYFTEGWLEFELLFDEASRLRRLYIHHRLLTHPSGHELQLTKESHCLKQDSQPPSADSRCIA